MKYILEPMLFALDENISEHDFKVYINRLVLWDRWLQMYPGDVYVLSDTSELLYEKSFFPIYPVFQKLMKRYDIDYIQASDLNAMINRLVTKAKKIDKMDGRMVDDEMIRVEVKTDMNLAPNIYSAKLRDAFERLLWCMYCQSQKGNVSCDSFVVFGKNQHGKISLDVEYNTIIEDDGELKEVVHKDKVKIVGKSSLADLFKDKDMPLAILKCSDSISDLYLAIRIAVYQNGNLKKVMDAFDNYNFRIQNSFHKDYTGNHYMSQVSFLTSFTDSMSHSLLDMNIRDLEDFRTGRGGNNSQKKHDTQEGVWEAWRWKVTESVSFQYWRLNEKFKFANIGEHDYYFCKWEE